MEKNLAALLANLSQVNRVTNFHVSNQLRN